MLADVSFTLIGKVVDIVGVDEDEAGVTGHAGESRSAKAKERPSNFAFVKFMRVNSSVVLAVLKKRHFSLIRFCIHSTVDSKAEN